jgi:hypothetical protein
MFRTRASYSQYQWFAQQQSDMPFGPGLGSLPLSVVCDPSGVSVDGHDKPRESLEQTTTFELGAQLLVEEKQVQQ